MWSVRKHRQWSIVPHRPNRLLRVFRHRRDNHSEFFECIAENSLPCEKRFVLDIDGAGGLEQAAQFDTIAVEPTTIRFSPRNRRFDFVIVHDTISSQIDKDHLTRSQTSFHQYVFRVDIEHPYLGCENEHAAFGGNVSRRSKTVSVECRTNFGSVGKRNRRRTVPGFHNSGVILEKGSFVLTYMILRTKRLRCHYHGRVLYRTTVLRKQFKRIVEHRGIAEGRVDYRDELFHLVAQKFGLQNGFTGFHFVYVSPERIDLTVVR